MSEKSTLERPIKILIGIELVCLVLIAWPSISALRWYGPENYALFAMALIGLPALFLQLGCMIVALIRTARLDEEVHDKGPFQWAATAPFVISAWLFGWAVFSEVPL